MSEAYKQAGVDIDAGNEAVERMKKHVKRTFRPEVLADLGGFGGLFALNNKYENPILVSGTDGVGTKLKLAFALDKHDTCLLYTSPSPRDGLLSRMPSSA